MHRRLAGAMALALPVLLACSTAPSGSASPAVGHPTRASGSQASPQTSQGQGAAQSHRAPNIHQVQVRWGRVHDGFADPTQVTSAPDGTSRMFVVEKPGVVRVVRGHHVQRRDYLNLTSRVTTGGEGGLASIAFSPNFRRDHRIYVAYARQSDGDLIIGRMTASRPKAKHVKSSTLRPLLRVEHSAEDNHYGGQLMFGPDGYLYIGTGDGGGQGNPDHTAGNPKDLRGKILRIDVSRSCGNQRYCTPRSNPYKGKKGRDEVYLQGLRNPWRFSFDSATGALWIGDVGQDQVEEVDRVAPHPQRIDLGWSCMEGRQPYGDIHCASRRPFIQPVTTYTHAVGESITGGFVYRGSKYQHRLGGAYLFADYVTARIWLYHRGQGKASQGTLGTTYGGITSFGVSDTGEVYAVTYGGTLWKLRLR